MLSFTLPVGPGAGTPRVPVVRGGTPVTSAGATHGSSEGRADGSLAPWILGVGLASQMRCEKLRLPPKFGWDLESPVKIVWKIFFKITWR